MSLIKKIYIQGVPDKLTSRLNETIVANLVGDLTYVLFS